MELLHILREMFESNGSVIFNIDGYSTDKGDHTLDKITYVEAMNYKITMDEVIYSVGLIGSRIIRSKTSGVGEIVTGIHVSKTSIKLIF